MSGEKWQIFRWILKGSIELFFLMSHLSALVPEELASVLYHLFVGQQTVGLLLTQGEDLPQRDAKRPHITGRGELALGGGE